MDKRTYINATFTNDGTSISSGGRRIDLLVLSAAVFCSMLNNNLKADCPDRDKLEIAYGLIDEILDQLKTGKQEITTIKLPPEMTN